MTTLWTFYEIDELSDSGLFHNSLKFRTHKELIEPLK